jgi:hypothetical protein
MAENATGKSTVRFGAFDTTDFKFSRIGPSLVRQPFGGGSVPVVVRDKGAQPYPTFRPWRDGKPRQGNSSWR